MSKILVVGPSWVGDMMMAQTLFLLLHQQQVDLQIDVLAPAWSLPLLSRMPEVNQAITSPFVHGELELRKRYRLGKSLRASQYGQAIVLPNSLKSALIPFWAKIPKRTGWLGEKRYGLLNDIRYLDKNALPKMVQRFSALAFASDEFLPERLPIPKMNISADQQDQALSTHQLTHPQKPVLALCPGAEFGVSKQWPEEYYAAVANHYLSKACDVWLFGSQNDVPTANTIQDKTGGRCVNLVGKTKLAEAIDLMSLVTFVVTNDSGLMHIAAALGKPLVAVYGSTSPDFTPPVSDKAFIAQAKGDIPCRPCFQRTCSLQHHDCMQKLLPEQVIDLIVMAHTS